MVAREGTAYSGGASPTPPATPAMEFGPSDVPVLKGSARKASKASRPMISGSSISSATAYSAATMAGVKSANRAQKAIASTTERWGSVFMRKLYWLFVAPEVVAG